MFDVTPSVNMTDASNAPNHGKLPDRQINALRDELIAQDQIHTLAALMNAAGNDTRMRILYLLWRSGEIRVNDLAAILDLTTPAISQQLKKLRLQELVRTRRDAQTIYYRLNQSAALIQCLLSFFEEGQLRKQ